MRNLCLALLLCVFCPPARAVPSPEELAAPLRAIHEEQHLQASLIGVWQEGRPLLRLALGESMEGVAANPSMHVRVGGVTLTSLCHILLQLAEQGRLSLDDPIGKYMSELPRAREVSLRRLANCTSGYPDYVTDPAFGKAVYADPFRQWRPEELVKQAFTRLPGFAPGEGADYSHTNFVILGMAMAKATGMTIPELFRSYLTEPLKLAHTVYPEGPAMPEPVLHSRTCDRQVYEDCTYWSPSWASYSGGLVSNLDDLGVLAEAVCGGWRLSAESRAAQVAPTTVGMGRNRADLYYGLGVIVSNGWLLNNPNMNGYRTIFAHLPEQRLSIVVVTTSTNLTPDQPNPALRMARSLAQRLAPDRELAPGLH